jgi:Family of unknown function (DUF5677)
MARQKRRRNRKHARRHKPAQAKSQTEKLIAVFGDPVAQEAFKQEHGELIKRLPRLYSVIQTTLSLVHKKLMINPDAIVMALSRMALEDFRQIMILCSNGETTGGMKILRGMFERTVTARYLNRNPEEVNAFINYEIDDCKKCETTRTNHTWTRLSLVSMAEKVGLKVPMLEGYYFPMQETHATIASIERRIKFDEETQTLTYDEAEGLNDRISALRTTHYLTLHVLETLRDQFGLHEELNDQLSQCGEDFIEIWQLPRQEEANR